MQWLANNWILVVVVFLMIGMHLFGHGGHGGNTRHTDKKKSDEHKHE